MRKTILSLSLLSFLLSIQLAPTVFAHNAGFPISYNPDLLIIDTIGEQESLDPAWAYDTASSEVIQSVYDGLVMYEVNTTKGPYEAGLIDALEPKLATSWSYLTISETSPEGLTWKHRYTFSIRQNVKFHDGNILTPQDVEYSFERLLVQDRDGGSQWMIYEFLLDAYGASPPSGAGSDPLWGNKIDHAVESNNTHFWFNLVTDFPSLSILKILSYTSGAVIEKSWTVAKGDFDGVWSRYPGDPQDALKSWTDIWNTWHNPATSFIEGDVMGTGPYKFVYWTPGASWSITKFDDYWDGWPARISLGSEERIGGYITTVTWYYYPLWTTRRPRLLAGDSDFSDVDRMYRNQILGKPGIRCYYPYSVLATTALFFTFDITTTSPYLGVPGGKPPGTFGEDGIPPNIFNDINVRKGFAYAFDYYSWLVSTYLGEGEQPSDPVIKGLLYDNVYQEKYNFNLGIAKTYLMSAWGGNLWNNGMKFTVTYNTGNVARETAAKMIADSINSLNPKFHLDTMGVEWGSTYLPQMVNGELPLFIIGWGGELLFIVGWGASDPHIFVHPFMHSQGTFAAWQKYNNPTVDAKIELGIQTPDGPERQQIYYDLQAIYHDDAPSVTLVQAVGRHYERDWVRGWHYHPVAQTMFYHFWKAQTHFGDANNDGAVDMLDKGMVSAYWTSAPGTTYNPSADMSGGTGGTTSVESGLVKGIADGTVDMIDLGMLSAYWDGPPQGPSHP